MPGKKIASVLVATALSLCLAGSAWAGSGPLNQLKENNEKLNQLARSNASTAVLKKKVNTLLDYGLLARNALKDHWAKRSATERTEFTTTFRSLIEKNYIKGIRKRANYLVNYKRQVVNGRAAQVFTVVKYMRRGRQRTTDITYKMRRGPRGWVVYDVITGDVSMEENYRNSFNRIIRKSGWAALMKKMKDKLAK